VAWLRFIVYGFEHILTSLLFYFRQLQENLIRSHSAGIAAYFFMLLTLTIPFKCQTSLHVLLQCICLPFAEGRCGWLLIFCRHLATKSIRCEECTAASQTELDTGPYLLTQSNPVWMCATYIQSNPYISGIKSNSYTVCHLDSVIVTITFNNG